MTDTAVSAPSLTGSNGQFASNESGKTVEANSPPEPNPNMTGEEAVAWVEAQKAKESATKGTKNLVKEASRDAQGKFMGKSMGDSTQDAVKEASAEAKRRMKIDDEEVDEDEVIKTYRERKGHQQAANKTLQEGKLARKQAEEFITMMKDPERFFDVAKKLGHDPRTLAEKRLAADLEEEMLDPREREVKKLTAKVTEYEKRENEIKQRAEEAEHQALTERYRKDYNDQFVKALTESSLPQTRETVAAMASHIARAARLKVEITAQEAAMLVEDDLKTQHSSIYRNADAASLVKLLGEENMKKIRKYDTDSIRNPEQFLKTPTEQAPIRQKAPTNRRMTPKEWREYNRK